MYLCTKFSVDAINALLGLSRNNNGKKFSRADCNASSQFGSAFTCTCSTECRITKITLSDWDLSGELPKQIGAFPQLKSLDLSDNKLSGEIPSLENLSQLSYLDLSGNRLRGSIPWSLVKLSQLSTLNLSDNDLRGRIPSLANWSQLSELRLSNNKLDGPIPSSLVNLSRLSKLVLHDNNLEGPLSLISELKSLKLLYLDNNKFNNRIPREFSALPLYFLSVSHNLLSGSIPVELGNISSLGSMWLDDNLLTGQLPPELGKLTTVRVMCLADNEFTGTLPSGLARFDQIRAFNIQGNNISGTIPDFIAKWQSLEELNLIGNNFQGPLPASISALRNLTALEIDNLAGDPGGSLFPDISNAQNLETLTLRNCSLNSRIPPILWQLPQLTYIDLSFNSLTGEIPIVSADQLEFTYIFLQGNKLNGSIPGWMLSTVSFLDISNNQFSNTSISGTIKPNSMNVLDCCSNANDLYKKGQKIIEDCANTSKKYDSLYINCGGDNISINGSGYEADTTPAGASTFFLSSNGAWGYSIMGYYPTGAGPINHLLKETCNIAEEDAPLYMTARVSPVSLKYYGFCLEDGDYIVKLHFAEIGWNKPSDKKGRRVFDVEIQGEKMLYDFCIEDAASGIDKGVIKEYPVAVNKSRLEIHLYWTGKGSDGPLISAISVSRAPKKHKNRTAVITSATVGSVALCSLLIFGLCWKLGWLGSKPTNGVELFPGGVFKSGDIKAATNHFAAENKIGHGGFGNVYKGTLPNGTEIAVKKLSPKAKQGAQEFITEMGIIFALKHPNLVRLLGCCLEEREQLLVYEYMENGALDQTLFGLKEVKAKLDWKRRVKICLDVAKGLAYLHECDLKIIHGDIKPQNILLDKDFNAKISDFGFARSDSKGTTTRKNAQSKEGETTPVRTRVKGTQGYIAPERMVDKDSPKVDVYSFGILTLEIVSGQPSSIPNPKGPTVYLLQKAYDYTREGNLLGLVDPSLGSDYNYKEAKVIICLAMNCINYDPDQRPTMSEVVKVLEGKKKIENVSVPVPVERLMTGKDTGELSESHHSTMTSFEGTSDPNTSLFTSKEIEDSSPSAHRSA